MGWIYLADQRKTLKSTSRSSAISFGSEFRGQVNSSLLFSFYLLILTIFLLFVLDTLIRVGGMETGVEFSTVAGKSSYFLELHSNPLTFTQRYRQIQRYSVDKKVKAMMQVMSTLFAVKLMYFFTIIANFYSFSLLTYP
jgi:hypothetical protein